MKKSTINTRLVDIIAFIVLIVVALLFVIPLLLAINTSFKTAEEEWNVLSIPSHLYFGGIVYAFGRISRNLIASALIAFPATLLSTLVGALAAYPLSQLKFKGDTFVYLVLLAGLYIPYTTVLIPLFFLIRALGLYDTIPGLWLTHIAYGIPYTTLILRNFFTTIPGELKEAAVIDGCGLVRYFWTLLLPLGRTGIAATLIIQFQAIWNEFLFGITLTRSQENYPVTVALQGFGSRTASQWSAMMAASLFTVIPTISVFLVFKKQFVRGLTGVYK